jgi:lysophospholipase L1-like esterase
VVVRCVIALAWVLGCSATPSDPVVPVLETRDEAPTATLPVVAPRVQAPVSTMDTEAAHAFALAHVLPSGPDPFARITGADARPWRFVPIEPAAALERFHAQLRKARTAPIRVAMYGASGTAADTHTAYVRAYLQQRFGDGGPGFVPLGRAKSWSRHAEVSITSSKGWDVLHAVRDRDGSVVALGPGGLAFESSRKRAWVELACKRDRGMGVRRLELFALAQPKGGTMRITIDDLAPTEHVTRAEATSLLRVPFDVEPGRHRVRVEIVGDGPVRLFGVAFETGTGVVVDTLGVDGARARNWARWDEAVWTAGTDARPPALVTLAYGTNEAVDDVTAPDRFRADFERVLSRIRAAAPDAACVVLGPGDFPEKTDAGWVGRPRISEIARIERELAERSGCAFWDELAFMGGPGSMTRWVATDPPLARDDHLHFAPAGAAVKGHFLVDALALGYDAATPR